MSTKLFSSTRGPSRPASKSASAIVPLLAALIVADAHAYGPGCPWCSNEAQVIGSSEPELHVSMKWCGIEEAPSVDDPTLVCQTNFKTMLWRRHERASDCIWIAQCKLTLRSGGTVSSSDYLKFADLDTSIGSPGDIVISPDIDEMEDTWEECDNQWAAQPKGVIAVSCRTLINDSGTRIARGIAYQGSITKPWLAVEDPTMECQLNERSLAHEAGHVLSLAHTATGLMETGGSGATLTLTECEDARDYLSLNTILDPPPDGVVGEIDRVDFVFDPRGDAEPQTPYLDFFKVVATDNSPTGGDLSFCLGTDGLVPGDPAFDITYWILLDIDNDAQTGGTPIDLIPGAPVGLLQGVEFVGQVKRDAVGDVSATLFEPGQFGFFVPVLLEPGLITAALRDINLVICDPLPAYTGPDAIPTFTEIDFTIDNDAFPFLFPGAAPSGPLFPKGIMIQATGAAEFTKKLDLAPDEGGLLELPEIVFPMIQIPEKVTRGDLVQVAVSGMPPAAALVLFFGEFLIKIDATSDENGDGAFDFLVPLDMPLGFTIATVGVDIPKNPDNAVTADAIVEVNPPIECEGDANGDGTVDPLDAGFVLARFGCPVGEGDEDCDAADVNGDGAVDPLDSGFVLARFGPCPKE